MKRTGILLAGTLVVATNVAVLVKTSLNRAGSPEAAIELTEPDLHLMRPQRDSTALFLRLEWTNQTEADTGWFNQAKLEELGFDCRVPVTGPKASEHYRSLLAKEAFVVMEHTSHLLPVDAGRDYAVLRKKYPGNRFLIVPALVRLHADRYLRGSIDRLLVREISVPPSQRHVFENLSETIPGKASRYSITLHYGRNHEPWIGSSRLIPATAP